MAVSKVGSMFASLFLSDAKGDSNKCEVEKGTKPPSSPKKHATYHGATKHSVRPQLDTVWTAMHESGLPAEPMWSNAMLAGISLTHQPTVCTPSEKRKSSANNSINDNEMSSPNSGVVTYRRAHRRTSSNSSVGSNINPSFAPDDEFQSNRPTTLDLNHPGQRRRVIESNQLSSFFPRQLESTPPTSSPLTSSPEDYWSRVPLSASPPQRTVRFNVNFDRNRLFAQPTLLPSLIDNPVEGQSQDNTLPISFYSQYN